MAYIKGQNLRIFADDVCVAASTSCQLHLAAATEDSTTKDSEGDWAENSCTGKSWDASVDALVVTKTKKNAFVPSKLLSGTTYTDGIVYDMEVGDVLTATTHASGQTVSFWDASTKTLISGGTSTTATYTATEKISVMVGYSAQSTTSAGDCTLTIADTALHTEDWFNYVTAGTKLTLKLEYTAGASGEKNRDAQKRIFKGECYVTDVSVTAANRQNSTITVQFTGTGEGDTSVVEVTE